MNFTIKPKSFNPTGTTANYMTIRYQCNTESYVYPLTNSFPITNNRDPVLIPSHIARQLLIARRNILVAVLLYVDGNNEFANPQYFTLKPTCKKPEGKYIGISA